MEAGLCHGRPIPHGVLQHYIPKFSSTTWTGQPRVGSCSEIGPRECFHPWAWSVYSGISTSCPSFFHRAVYCCWHWIQALLRFFVECRDVHLPSFSCTREKRMDQGRLVFGGPNLGCLFLHAGFSPFFFFVFLDFDPGASSIDTRIPVFPYFTRKIQVKLKLTRHLRRSFNFWKRSIGRAYFKYACI